MGFPCTYCGCEVTDHDPVSVVEGVESDDEITSRFCNYGCLVAHVEAAGLATGSACSVV